MTGHPLFPADADDDEFECSWVQVAREERGLWITAPEMYPAEELHSLEQIAGRYGGGHYKLTARHGGPSGRQLITRVVQVRLPGPSLSLDGTSAPPEQGAPAVGPGPLVPQGIDPTLGLIMQMMQQSNQMMMTMFVESNKTTASVLAAALGRGSGDGGAGAVAQLAGTALQAITAMRTPAAGGVDAFQKGIEFADRMAGGGNDDGGGEDLMGTIGQISAGVQAAAAMMPPPGATPPPGGTVPHAPPRSQPPAHDPNAQVLPHTASGSAPAGPGGGGGARERRAAPTA